MVYSYDRTSNLRKDGTASVTIRAYQGKYSYFNTGVYIQPSQWCNKRQRVKNHDRALRLNGEIESVLRKLEKIEADITYQTGSCTLDQLVKNYNQGYDQNFIAFAKTELENERNRISPSSHRNFAQTIGYLEVFSPKMSFSDIKPATVRAFQNFLFDQKLHHNTVQKHYRFFRKYVNIAEQQRLIKPENNPFRKVKMAAKKTDIVFLTQEELSLFRSYEVPANKPLQYHVQQCFLFCCFTGLRFCDLCQLTSDHFYENEKGFFLQIEKLQKTKKPYLENIRHLFFLDEDQGSLPEQIIKELIKAPDYKPGQKICKVAYENANTFRRHLKLIAQSLPIRANVQAKIGTHTARHTFGTYMAANKVDPVVLQDLLRHANLNETMIYVHLTQERKEEVLKNTTWKL